MSRSVGIVLFISCILLLLSCKERPENVKVIPTFSISGSVNGTNYRPSHVVISIGSEETYTTDTGSYVLTDLKSGSYKLIPQLSGFQFVPESIDVTVNGKNVTGIDFSILRNVEIIKNRAM